MNYNSYVANSLLGISFSNSIFINLILVVTRAGAVLQKRKGGLSVGRIENAVERVKPSLFYVKS